MAGQWLSRQKDGNAVPGLSAKPVLDVAIAVSSLTATADWPDQLTPAGYKFFGDRENWNEHFYAKGPEECRTGYLHVIPVDDRRWSNYLRFRDLLRANAALRDSYAQAKFAAAAAHFSDRKAYTAAKEQLIRQILG